MLVYLMLEVTEFSIEFFSNATPVVAPEMADVIADTASEKSTTPIVS